MRYDIGVFTILVLLYFVEVNGLECGIGKSKSDKLGQAISMCIKHNKTLEKLWDKTASSLTSMEPNESNESEEKVKFSHTRKGSSFRYKRASKSRNYHDDDEMASTTEMPSSEENDRKNNNKSNSKEKESTPCVVQCIFQNLGMTDDDGFPDHKKIVEGLVSTASRRELKDFLQDTADDCFQETETEKKTDSCAYSSAIITCLAEKGKENCSDWPVGNLPF